MERNEACMSHNPNARIIESVANQEGALACILNQECEKLHKAICMARSIDELTDINESVVAVLNAIANLESQLRQKLELVVDTHH